MANSSIKDQAQYEALRRDGATKEKAARIANASADTSRSATGHRGGEAGRYEEHSKHDLTKRRSRSVSKVDRRCQSGNSSTRCAITDRQQRTGQGGNRRRRPDRPMPGPRASSSWAD